MECLFKTATKNTLEEYKRFSIKLQMNTKSIILYILMTVFLVLSGIVLDNPFFIAFAIIYPIVLWIMLNHRIKKVYASNKVLQDTDVNYEFYNTYFVETNNYGTTQLEYNKLNKIIETKTNFYLMIAKNQGFILSKSEFPQGLSEFLRTVKQENRI